MTRLENYKHSHSARMLREAERLSELENSAGAALRSFLILELSASEAARWCKPTNRALDPQSQAEATEEEDLVHDKPLVRSDAPACAVANAEELPQQRADNLLKSVKRIANNILAAPA